MSIASSELQIAQTKKCQIIPFIKTIVAFKKYS